jgi:choloylglycine hydrolase
MHKLLLGCFLAVLMSTYELGACTGIRLTATDGSVVNGRTVEFDTPIDMYTAVIPRDFTFTGKTPEGNGLTYKSKYAAAGIYCFDYKVLMDGMNEKGLTAAAFYFPGYAQYATVTKDNQSKALSPVEFPNWILTQFATIDEVKEAISSVVIAPTVLKNWGDTPAPFHYVVYDKQGNSIVIEPLNGTLVVYDNEIGTITNSPTFDWHMTNLRNFINLRVFNVDPINLRGVELAPFGQGSGMVGLPGDFTAPSRFVRAAFFSSTAIPSKDANTSVNQAFHILNQFDIPVGFSRQREGADFSNDYTMLTSVKDSEAIRYYYKSYDDQTIKFVDLKQVDLNAKTIKSIETKGEFIGMDVSNQLRS